jgi:outer membrane protein assembly factor BamB
MKRVALLAAIVVCGSVVSAQDWNQWRGPARNGSVTAASTPKWPAAGQNWKRAWRVDVGEGYSAPVVAAGRAFVHSRRDPEELVTAIDLASGKVLWQQKYTTPFNKNQYASGASKGPHATPARHPVVASSRSAAWPCSAWNAQTGALAAQGLLGLGRHLEALHRTAASPLADGGSVIVQVGSDVKGGRVIALDPQTGAERWTWTGKGPGYASPVVVTAGGVKQIVTMTNGSIEGIDAKTGASLWSSPFPDDYHENIVTPVWTGTHLVASSSRAEQPAYAAPNRGKWEAAEAWKVAVRRHAGPRRRRDYRLSSKKGQIVAMDAATGALKWSTEGRAADQAAILLTAAHVLVLTTGGELVLVRRSPAKYDEERRYTVADSATWAVPILLPDGLIIRDASGIMRLTP